MFVNFFCINLKFQYSLLGHLWTFFSKKYPCLWTILLFLRVKFQSMPALFCVKCQGAKQSDSASAIGQVFHIMSCSSKLHSKMQALMKSICVLLPCIVMYLIFSIYTFSPVLDVDVSIQDVTLKDIEIQPVILPSKEKAYSLQSMILNKLEAKNLVLENEKQDLKEWRETNTIRDEEKKRIKVAPSVLPPSSR